MHPKQSIPQGIWRLAAEQGGVFSHAQVVELGLTRHVIQRALDDKIWWQAARGLYSLTPYRTWLGSAHGGLLLAGEGAVLGGAAAGHLYGWCAAPEIIDVYVPARRRDRGIWRFHQIATEGRGTPARTTPERTALDLCADLAPADAIGLLADALHSRRTTAPRLLEQLDRMPKLRKREALGDVLTDVAAGMLSELERRFSVEVLARHGLPRPPASFGSPAPRRPTSPSTPKPSSRSSTVGWDTRDPGHSGINAGTTATPRRAGSRSGTGGTTSLGIRAPSRRRSPRSSSRAAGEAVRRSAPTVPRPHDWNVVLPYRRTGCTTGPTGKPEPQAGLHVRSEKNPQPSDGVRRFRADAAGIRRTS